MAGTLFGSILAMDATLDQPKGRVAQSLMNVHKVVFLSVNRDKNQTEQMLQSKGIENNMNTMKATANLGRRGSEYIHVKGTRYRAPRGTKVKPGTKLTVTQIRQGSVRVQVGSAGRGAGPKGSQVRNERWFRVSPLKGAVKRQGRKQPTARRSRG